MLTRLRILSITGPLTAVAVATASAQQPLEIGMDAGFDATFNGDAVWSVTVPVQQVRVGFMAADQFSVEPRLSFNFISNGGSVTTLQASAHVLYHIGPGGRSRPYVTAGGTFFLVDFDGNSKTDFAAGAGVGVTLPILAQLAARLEGRYDRMFDAEANIVSVTIGLSVFTR
ncbi:MAG: outer membrane beta-barrel protein [Gemmatimonadales bacterium]|nr:outer membrane beta-barrel protein [Gemmatimonadales bacterium]NIN13154.1 outer membrane beta-barrel protein [Gemmatimonadales bacterium]NIN51432.1 outer membrane beta-barrel protein [Gemmatimonadales bacterium]NIP08896.1 outer membrane beta-barrel protein [Gemmatimonadales bacterium]NIR03684.1 outer membrane beta-barrel protein [Gemmatimonadales bacterium]